MPYSHYNVYWRNMNEEQWKAEEARIRIEEQRQRERAARTVDEMNFGEQQPETDHALKSERSRRGRFSDRGYRNASPDGWIEFRMKVNPHVRNILFCTYWGGDARAATEIFVEGQSIAVERLTASHPGRFFEQEYTIPADLTKDKEYVTIRFQPVTGSGPTASVYHAAILVPEGR